MTVTQRAVAFTVAVCVLLIGLDGWQSWRARDVQIHEMERDSSNLASAAAEHADQTIKAADTILVGLVERVQYDGVGPTALTRLNHVLGMRQGELPELNGLFVYDQDGNWLASSLSSLPSGLNNSDREYFAYHRDHAELTPHIGVMVRSRSSGKWILPVSRRINHADGSFAGVALATIDAAYFSRFYDSLDIGQAGAIGILLERGVLLVRRPFVDVFVNKDMTNTSVLLTYASRGPVVSFFTLSSQDGVNRMNSLRRLRDYPVFVAVALSKDERLAQWQRDTLRRSGAVIFLAAIVSFFGWRLIQQIELRARAEADLISTQVALTRANQTLERLAMQDGLTKLANRRQFDVALDNEMSRAARHGTYLAIVMIDIDLFKQFNDCYGHAGGDECLREVSRGMRGTMPGRPGDLLARYGGEELVVLLPNTDQAGALVIAQRLRSAVEALHIPHARSPFGYVTISAGVYSAVPRRGAVATTHIRPADEALYRAKASGRNRVCINDAIPS